MAKVGRPPIPPEDIIAWQKLYLDLLAQGKTEAEVSAVEGMPSWPIRYKWQDDAEFLTNRSRAHAHGATIALLDARTKLEDTYQRALDDAASPQLVAITDKIAQHARWLASRLGKDYADKQDLTTNGKDIKGGVIIVANQKDKDALEDL
jgi:hypothetical protein